MEQTLELMRKRHAYYTKLIVQNNIHSAREFYERLNETFEMFGVDLFPDDGTCLISITCEDYDYEEYTVCDGINDGLATVSPIIEWNHPIFGCSENLDIFQDHPDFPY